MKRKYETHQIDSKVFVILVLRNKSRRYKYFISLFIDWVEKILTNQLFFEN